MDPMNLLVVEQGADWTHWSRTNHLVGHAMLVLAQHGDEPAADFRQRIRNKLSRIKKQGLKSVVLLRGRSRGRASDALVQELESESPTDFRVFPAVSESMAALVASASTVCNRTTGVLPAQPF